MGYSYREEGGWPYRLVVNTRGGEGFRSSVHCVKILLKVDNIPLLVLGFFSKFTLKMNVSWSISQSTPKDAFVKGDWSVNCCSLTLSLLSSAGIVFKIALLFDGNYVRLKPRDLHISFMFLIRPMVCTSFLTNFNESSTNKFSCKVSETYNP